MSSDRRSERNQTLTEKGRQYQLTVSTSLMKSCEKRLAKQVTIIDSLLSGSNIDFVNSEMNTLQKSYDEFTDSYSRACKLLSDQVDGDEVEQFTEISILMDTVDSKYLWLKEKVCGWLLEKEKMAKHRSVSICSGASKHSRYAAPTIRSGGSSKHTRSTHSASRSDLSLRQKAKVAELKVEAEILKRMREAELSAELSRLELKIKKAEAKEKVYSSHNEAGNSQANVSVHALSQISQGEIRRKTKTLQGNL